MTSTPKRQKVGEQSYRNVASEAYNSENDQGDVLFEEHGRASTLPFQDVPTQPLEHTSGTVATVPLSKPKPSLYSDTFELLSSTPSALPSSSVVQVEASSPSQHHEQVTQRSKPIPMARGALNGFASAMAPPGTAYRAPVQAPPERPKGVDLSDDSSVLHSDSSDNEGTTKADIKPSLLLKSSRPNHLPPATRIEESPKDNTKKFKSLASQFTYNQPPRAPVPDMASAYGAHPRHTARPIPKQTGPARARPVQDKSIDDIPDDGIRHKIANMMKILPNQTVASCEHALARRRGNMNDAMELLADSEEPIDLTVDELAAPGLRTAALPKPAAKRHVQAPTRSIQDKYSSTQTAPRPTQVSNLVLSSPPSSVPKPQPRRRLVQGRKGRSSPTVASSPPPLPLPQQQSTKRQIAVASDESDSGLGTDFVETSDHTELESRLLNFINTCSAKELADISNQTLEVANLIVSKRPFVDLDKVRHVSSHDAFTKTGKRSTKKAIGDKIVDVCLEMWTGYEAVDELVLTCESLGQSVAKEMQKWGFDVFGASKDGELQLTALDAAQDSGIGTPSSSVSDDDSASKTLGMSKNGFIRQPAIMSEDLQLKDYQVAGLNWLALLYRKGLSCILADDMGLGKTCQVIAFLSHLFETGEHGCHLIVVPGSTLENWLREFQRFSPALNVEPYYGLQNERAEQRVKIEDNIRNINVIITTYDLAAQAKDASFLRHQKPTVCVYDEGHALRNSTSKRYKALMRIPAKFRLLLTGTPLQNNLQELVSLLNFLMPNVFAGREEDLASIFKHRAKTSDSDHSALLSAQRIARARSMMTPFILRRKKHQVLKHMPVKTCRVEHCEMHPSQAAIYNEQKQAHVKAMAERKAGKADAASAKHTQNVLMQLRQAAIHPLLFRRLYNDVKLRKMSRACLTEPEFARSDPQLCFEDMTVMNDIELHAFCENYPSLQRFALEKEEWMDSGKVQKLCELLKRFKANGDRTLVFSQFTTVMNILERVLETLEIQFFRLDGQTPIVKRQDMLDEFYKDTTIPVFMLSTKAGGSGINLACANKVIIFDSSFNPQEDIQAENRAHRVGQTREVEVIRLVTRSTIEEQIHLLGQSKLALDDRVAGEGATQLEEAQAEEDGRKEVEKMLLQGTGADQTEADNVLQGSTKEEGKRQDLKDEYLNALAQVGLDMSAA